MGYREESFIIDPEVEDDEQPIVQKEMEPVSIANNRISREYEIVEPEPQEKKSVFDEIHETAVKEGLVDEDEDPIGGENPTPEDVINDLKSRGMSKGAKKNKEEYEEKKVKTFAKVTATRDILTGMTKRLINVSVPVVMDCKHEDGSIAPELVELDFKVQRLTESQINHLINRKLANKTEAEMTDEEFKQTAMFRSQFLSTVIMEPQMTPEEWHEDVPAAVLTSVFDKVQSVLNTINDVSLFQ